MAAKISELRLPGALSGVRQLHQCIRQLESVSNQLVQMHVQHRAGLKAGGQDLPLPHLLEALLQHNQLELSSAADVDALKTALEKYIKSAPRLKFTFATDPEAPFLAKLVDWVREHIHPMALVDVAVSSYVAGGFVLQTPLRRYDFSWRTQFEAEGGRFTELLKANGAKSDEL